MYPTRRLSPGRFRRLQPLDLPQPAGWAAATSPKARCGATAIFDPIVGAPQELQLQYRRQHTRPRCDTCKSPGNCRMAGHVPDAIALLGVNTQHRRSQPQYNSPPPVPGATSYPAQTTRPRHRNTNRRHPRTWSTAHLYRRTHRGLGWAISLASPARAHDPPARRTCPPATTNAATDSQTLRRQHCHRSRSLSQHADVAHEQPMKVVRRSVATDSGTITSRPPPSNAPPDLLPPSVEAIE